MTPKIYLAGAIRDNIDYDWAWREQVIDRLSKKARFLNPMGGKMFNATNKQWTMNGILPVGKVIVKHDFWCVRQADIILFNFSALMDKYPNIGTLIEFGHATAYTHDKLLYSVIDPEYTGHSNLGLFKLHPFIEENSAATFPRVNDMLDFLDGHLDVLTGQNPHFCPIGTTRNAIVAGVGGK